MKIEKLIVGNEHGLNLGAVASIVELLGGYEVEISFVLGGNQVNAKSLMDTISLAVP